MDINALKTFLEVAKTRHFAQAADNLFVSQSTISARIRTLEELLGVSLFVRERGNIHLSKEGEAFMTHAKSMMTLWARAQQEIGGGKGVRETLNIGGLPGLWDISLHHWLARIRQARPDIAIAADIFGPKTLINRVTDGTLDIAFVYDAPQSVNLVSHSLPTIELLLVSARKFKRLPDDWQNDFIQVDWGMSFAVQFAAEFPEVQAARLQTTLGRIAMEQLLGGSGFAYLAEPAIREALEQKRLFRVPSAPTFKRQASAIFHADSNKTDLIKQLVEFF